MLILLNPNAAGGRASARWEKISKELEQRKIPFQLTRDPLEVLLAFNVGERHFVAAGGDGTVNKLVALLISHLTEEQLATVILGAIGIGSSNDYHKSQPDQEIIAGYPCRLQLETATLRDILMIQNEQSTHFAMLNVGVGVTAQANQIFNTAKGIIGILKKLTTQAAIGVAVIKTLCGYAIRKTHISIGKLAFDSDLANLNIIKSPHVSGSLCYPHPLVSNNGEGAIYLCEKTSVWGLIKVLIELSRQQFTLSSTQKVFTLTQDFPVTIESNEQFPIEYDGELLMANRVQISIKKQYLRCS